MSRPKVTSMQDIADVVGVSRATVSNALRGTGRLSPETAKQILEAAERLDFTPSNLGRALRTGKSSSIGLILPDFRMPLFAEFARAFALAADQKDMVLSVCDSMGSHNQQLRHLGEMQARGVDAVIIIPVRGTPPDALIQSQKVLVLDAPSNPQNSLSSDHFSGGVIMGQYLLEQGHRHILLLDSDHQDDPRGASRVNDCRRDGFVSVLQRGDVTLHRLSMPARFEQVRDHFLTQDISQITAIAATYDALALGAMHALLVRGVAVPDQITITGFDDTVWGQVMHPSLTTIRQDLTALAQTAFSIALGEAQAGQILPVQLVTRGSSQTLKHSPSHLD